MLEPQLISSSGECCNAVDYKTSLYFHQQRGEDIMTELPFLGEFILDG